MGDNKHRTGFNRHLLHPWAELGNLGHDEETTVISHGRGAYVYDSDGNKLLDGPGGMWCMQTGYGRKEIANAVSEQIIELGYSTTFSHIHHSEVELAKRIAHETPGDLDRVFFTTGGSTAVDSAIRLCQLASNIKDKPHRKHILTRHKAYHGSTYLAASVSGKERDKTAMDVSRENIHFLSAPCYFYYPEFDTEEEFCDHLIAELENMILRAIIGH